MRTAFFGSAIGAWMHSYYNNNNNNNSSTTSDVAHCEKEVSGRTFEAPTRPYIPTPPAFDPKEFRAFPLVNSYDESPDTKVMRFAFPDGLQSSGMHLTSFVLLRYKDESGQDVVRPYTPISRLDQKGYAEILVKCYKDSKMGTHLHKLKLGQTIEIKGPFEKLPYQPGQYKKIGMIAGGSGITPMFQLMRECLKEVKPPEVSLIYANRRKEDVLLGSEISEFYELYQHFAPYFVLDDPPKDWMGGIGHVTKDMVKAIMPPPTRVLDSIICVCGPPGFMKHICGEKDFTKSPPAQGEVGGLLKELGYPTKMVYKF
jgi:cytochrome-b5 reductase